MANRNQTKTLVTKVMINYRLRILKGEVEDDRLHWRLDQRPTVTGPALPRRGDQVSWEGMRMEVTRIIHVKAGSRLMETVVEAKVISDEATNENPSLRPGDNGSIVLNMKL